LAARQSNAFLVEMAEGAGRMNASATSGWDTLARMLLRARMLPSGSRSMLLSR